MNPTHADRFRLSASAFHLLLSMTTLALIVGSTWLTALRADQELRADLVQQARMVAMAVNPQQVTAALSGTAADLASPYYQRIKEQLTRIRLSNPACRFLYLMSLRPDGTIIIHVDSEPANSKDYSPPGQTYDEAPGELHEVFATGRGAVKGPYDDRWGTWVSAFVPLPDPVTGGVQTVFGMDIASADWKWTVALRAALPAVLVVVAAMLGLLVTLLYRSRRDIRAHQEVLRERRRYRELSIVDSLTQLYNSRHFYIQLKKETERSDRYGHPLTLLLLDLDNFKAFNDAHGHVEGDQVLSRLGHVLKRLLRETDSAYRYGGEEFAILLSMTTSEGGVVTAERIRTEFKNETFSPTPGEEVHMTVSIGLTQYKTKEEIKVFVDRVDQLMYQGKKNGKDRVCCES